MKTTHTHHILPRHAGGTDDESNLIELSIKDHALAHKDLYLEHGRLEDKLAWKLLEGKTEEGEHIQKELAKLKFKEKVLDCPIAYDQFTSKLRAANLGKKATAETKEKMSKSQLKAYKEGRLPAGYCKEGYVHPKPTEAGIENARLGRLNSEKWRKSVTSDEYKLKKSKVDPRSKAIIVNGTEYPSLRWAAKSTKFSYGYLREVLILKSKANDNIIYA